MVVHQLILFGPPGTSKSFQAKGEKAKQLKVDDTRIVPVAFHPDYGYGEFVARLMPLTRNGQIEYNVHAGPFIRALAQAYHHLDSEERVLLLIDEINRGNCAEIFGDIFQLLDREENGWSSYGISTSDLVLQALEDELKRVSGNPTPFTSLSAKVQQQLASRKLWLPPNLHLIGTMNTSDESIYFMDSAFKRRWHFEFCPVGFERVPDAQRHAPLSGTAGTTWEVFATALNQFITARCTAPQLDDKLVGPWFIKARPSAPLSDRFPSDWAQLHKHADGTYKRDAGADRSDDFDVLLIDILKRLPPAEGEALKAFAGCSAKAFVKGTRHFSKIEFDAGSKYYRHSSSRSQRTYSGELIDEFMAQLDTQSTQFYCIDRQDLVGKLFLYLWDNVFARDKSPLYKLLGCKYEQLRTFGQLVAQGDAFIQAIVDFPDNEAEEARIKQAEIDKANARRQPAPAVA